MLNGLHWVGVELEARFCALAQDNIDLWNKRYSAQMPNWGTAVIVRGDSRRLGEVLERANLCLSSPPYANSIQSGGDGIDWGKVRGEEGKPNRSPGRGAIADGYSINPQNLGNLPDTGFGAALTISSPVYHSNTASDDPDKRGGLYRDPKRRNDKTLTATYSEDEAQLAQMPEGKLAEVIKYGVGQYGERWQDVLAALPEGSHAGACERPLCCISSPPYAHDAEPHGDLRPNSKVFIERSYGREQGQLAQMPPGDHEAALEAGAETGRAQACISSPPWENQECFQDKTFVKWDTRPERKGTDWEKKAVIDMPASGYAKSYGTTTGQLGQQQGSTFWAASRQILEEVYKALAPGAHAIFVCKRFVRDKKIVEFSTQWAHLCEAVGFRWIHHHKAWLVEDRGAQHTLEGGLEKRTVKRFSFFRRLHAQKYPELEIAWEDVLCFIKE